MSDKIVEVFENKEDKTKLTGVDLLASFFTFNNGVAIPLPNIAQMLDDNTLLEIGHNVINGYEADLDSMQEWNDYVENGKKLVKQEQQPKSTPWDGASNFKSPTLMQAALKWSDRATSELLRQDDIVKTSIIGRDPDGEKEKQADRVAEYSNYQINIEMKEWRDEHEKILYTIPYDGTAFKKTFFDARLGRPVSSIIVAPNFIVNNKLDSIERMRRFSEIIELSKNEVMERENQGLWIDTELALGAVSGEDDNNEQAEADKFTTFIEQQGYFDLDGDGYEEPYTFVVELTSKTVVRIIPRFELSDVLVNVSGSSRAIKLSELTEDGSLPSGDIDVVRIKPIQTITKYGFLRDPDGGFLDVGYSYILGALTMATNALTNQLVDAGTLSNRSGGWLARGFRKKMGNSAFKPFEWKQTGLSAQDLQSGIMPLPIKEPSPTLFTLMQFMIQSSQELSASADLTKALGANAPATTTLALVQEQQQSASAIILRVYRSMTSEFRKIFELNSKFLDPIEYQEVLDDPQANFEEDFNLRKMSVFPVANPEISSKIQRIQQAEAELSRAELVNAVGGDVRILVKRFYQAIGTQNIDEIFPELSPQDQLQKLLVENPDLAQMISGERERLDLIAAAAADAEAAQQQREDIKTAMDLDKVQSEIEKNESATILNLEKAETEDLNNGISVYTADIDLYAKRLQNQKVEQELAQPQVEAATQPSGNA